MSDPNQSPIWDDPRITAYAVGELSGQERVDFETEIAANPDLSAAVQDAQAVTGQLSNLFAAETTPGLDDARRAQVIADSSTVTPLRKSANGGGRAVRYLAMAVCACIAVAIAIPFAAEFMQSPETNVAVVSSEATEADAAAPFETADAAEEEESHPFASKQANEKGIRGSKLSQATADESSFSVGSPAAPASTSATRSIAPPAKPLLKQQAGQKLEPIGRAKASTIERTQSTGNRSIDRDVMNMEVMDMEMGMDMGMDMEMGMMPMEMDAAGMGGMAMGAEAGMGMGGSPGPSALPPAQDAGTSRFSVTEAKQSIAKPRGSVMLHATPRIIILDEEEVPQTAFEPTRADAIVPGNPQQGNGPGNSGDRFDPIVENEFKRVLEHTHSTFSIDVDTASYSKMRDTLGRMNQLPRPASIRTEELVNYFDYAYEPPSMDSEHPFASRVEIADCPWNKDHRLARIALKGKQLATDQRPRCNLVFLLDTSGSMSQPNKLPLVQSGMKMLLKQLRDDDRVAIVTYAGSAGLVLDSTKAKNKKQIRRALTTLSANGSTNGGQGITLAYQTARDHFIDDGVNRVILCTDGDFNVGTTSTDALVDMVEKEAKGGVFLTVMGFGMGNHNDAMLERVSGQGNGNYAFIDSENEARKVLVQQTNSTLVTIAKDVKIQVVFNQNRVSAYRLIGYENRILAKEDFNDDTKDAGEIGAGHAVTAIYELVPVGTEVDAIAPEVDPSPYLAEKNDTERAKSNELLTLKLRYKQPDGDVSTKVEFPIKDETKPFAEASDDFRFATSVAGFAMQLRRSQHAGSWTLSDVLAVAQESTGEDRYELRREFVGLVQKASQLMGEQ